LRQSAPVRSVVLHAAAFAAVTGISAVLWFAALGPGGRGRTGASADSRGPIAAPRRAEAGTESPVRAAFDSVLGRLSAGSVGLPALRVVVPLPRISLGAHARPHRVSSPPARGRPAEPTPPMTSRKPPAPPAA